MKIFNLIVGVLLTLSSFVGAQEVDSIVVRYNGAKKWHYTMSADTTFFYNQSNKLLSTIVSNKNGHVFKTSTGYKSRVIKEENAEFTYVLDSGKWVLQTETLFYKEGITPYYINRCHAITIKGTRCKRKGDPFCWQHK